MSVISKITNVLGATDSTIFDELQDKYDIITEGVWEAAALLPATYMAQATTPSNDPENIPNDTDEQFPIGSVMDDGHEFEQDDIILAVERVFSESTFIANVPSEKYLTRFAKEIPITQKSRVLDTDSIHLATNWSPVFWFENKVGNSTKKLIYGAPSTVAVFKEIGSANYLDTNSSAFRVYKYSKVTIDDATTEANAFAGFPQPTLELVYYHCATKLITAVLNKQGIEEEDTELFQLLSAQKAELEKTTAAKLQFFRENY